MVMREAAAAESKQRIQAAQKEARQMREEQRSHAEAEAKALMHQAEEQAAGITKQVLDAAQQDCERQKEQARKRLDQAAQWIVERVVDR